VVGDVLNVFGDGLSLFGDRGVVHRGQATFPF
jgi:hypothetical protein